MEKKLTVVYDDKCPMCSVGMNAADILDANDAVEFVGMNSERGKLLIQEHNFNMNASAYAIHVDGKISQKRFMMQDVLAHNGIAGFIFSLPFRIPYIGDALYELLAFVRSRITRSPR